MLKRIIILGGGISGLSLAWYLKKLSPGISLIIIEKEKRTGGWIQTIDADGFLFDVGPRSCRSYGSGKETLALAESLHLQNQVITSHPNAKNRFIFDHGKLVAVPQHLWQIPFSPLTKGWMQALVRDLWTHRRASDDESIYDFFSRHIGPSWTEKLIDPLILGIYAGDCRHLSLQSTFPLLDRWEKQHRSLIIGALKYIRAPSEESSFVRAMSKFPLFSFLGGMETLTKALTHELKDSILLGKSVCKLELEKENSTVYLDDGTKWTADHVISALSTHSLSPLLSDFPLLQEKLQKLSYKSLFVVHLGYRKKVLAKNGFGYLIPSTYNLPILGCVWDSSIFPEQSQSGEETRMTMMIREDPSLCSEESVIACALQEAREHMDIHVPPDFVRVSKIRQAIPQFFVGYEAWKQEVVEELQRAINPPKFHIAGSWWSGVSVNDCIAHSRRLAEKMVRTQ